MALSKQEEIQIRKIVEDVVQRSMEEFVVIQAQFVSDRLLDMTERYVKALMDLARVLGLPESASRKEADRIAELMLTGLK